MFDNPPQVTSIVRLPNIVELTKTSSQSDTIERSVIEHDRTLDRDVRLGLIAERSIV